MEELWKLDAFEISKLFKKKDVSAVEICQQTINHIQNTNPKINAIVIDYGKQEFYDFNEILN